MADRPAIVHLIYALDTGGCEQQLLRILPATSGFEHIIITLHHKGELAPLFERAGIEVKTVGWRNFMDISAYRQLNALLREMKPALVMTYLFHADAVGRLSVRTLTKYRPIPWLRTTYNSNDPRFIVARVFEWLTKPLVSRYLANSEAVREFYRQNLGVKRDRIVVIPNAIDPKNYDKKNGPATRERLGLKNNAFMITCVANLHVNKGHKYLLEAFSGLRSTSLELILVGDGAERQALEEQASKSAAKNRIHFLGQRRDVADILSASDLFVFPTLFEGMSNALMEAAASGTAIIATDIPENRTLLKENALYFPAGNAQVLEKTILELVENDDKRKMLGQSAQQLIAKKHSLSSISSQLTEFYKQNLIL